MKILVVLTGGTIGSRISDNLIDVDDSSSYALINRYIAEYGEKTDFEVINPINILSENLRPKYWRELYEGIAEAIERNRTACVSDISDDSAGDKTPYDGIIITHGSDTLAYTSAFLGFVLESLEIPVLITAANYPLEDERSNGLRNFAACVDFIRESQNGREGNFCVPTGGVFTVFENHEGRSVVYLSTRLREAEGFGDRFLSFGNEPFGWMKDGNFIINDKDINPSPKEISRNRDKNLEINRNRDKNLEICRNRDKTLEVSLKRGRGLKTEGTDLKDVDLDFPNEVVLIHSYPGLNYANFDFGSRVKAVCLVLYHSSTACTGEDDCSVSKLIEKCGRKGIDVYLCPFKELNSRMYASSSTFLTKEVNPLLNISPEAAYVKCLLAYNQKDMDPREFMDSNLFFETLRR